MKLSLVHTMYSADGIWGQLLDELGEVMAFTLEHSYPFAPLLATGASPNSSSNSFTPKLGPGTYECVRGIHELHSGSPFSTFEITGIKGHTGILFHVGNVNADSEGCVLLGQSIMRTGAARALCGSKLAFMRFMSELEGLNSFTLEVRNE